MSSRPNKYEPVLGQVSKQNKTRIYLLINWSDYINKTNYQKVQRAAEHNNSSINSFY